MRPPFSTVTAPAPLIEATLNEKACGGPMCGVPSRLNRMRSIALASVAVPTVERGSAAHPLLVDDDRRGEPVEDVDVRARHRRHEALHERAVRLVDQPLRLGGDRAEHERALARARHAREHREPSLRDLEADVLEVVHPGAVHPDQVMAVGGVQGRFRGALAHWVSSVRRRAEHRRAGGRRSADRRAPGSGLRDPHEVARRVAERAVAGAPGLRHRLLQHLGAGGPDRLERGVEVVGAEDRGLERALRHEREQRVALGLRATAVRLEQHDVDVLPGAPTVTQRKPSDGDVVADLEAEGVAVEAERGVGVVDGDEHGGDGDCHAATVGAPPRAALLRSCSARRRRRGVRRSTACAAVASRPW